MSSSPSSSLFVERFVAAVNADPDLIAMIKHFSPVDPQEADKERERLDRLREKQQRLLAELQRVQAQMDAIAEGDQKRRGEGKGAIGKPTT